MARFHNHITSVLAFLTSGALALVDASPPSPVAWEIHQAFPTWVEGEAFLVFARVVNVGAEILPLSGTSAVFEVKQTMFIPQWKDGPHHHGNIMHSHHLPQADAPWKSNHDWREEALQLLDEVPSRALLPGQSEVIGDRDLRGLWSDGSMPSPHMASFHFALRLGPDRYAMSEAQNLVFSDIPKLEAQPILQKIQKEDNSELPIRRITVAAEEWLFARAVRIARIPKGATPKFHTEDEKQVLVVEFEGVEEEPVRILIRQGFPLSGSIRTVPHLHLWRSLTNRSINEYFGTPGGFYKETGLTLAKARTLKWDGTDPELQAKPVEYANPRPQPNGQPNQDQKNETVEDRSNDGKRPAWPWILGGLLVAGFLMFFKIKK